MSGLHVVAHLMRDHIGLREAAGLRGIVRPPKRVTSSLEEVEVDVHLLVGRAVEGPLAADWPRRSLNRAVLAREQHAAAAARTAGPTR